MKKSLVILSLIACGVAAQAQGTFQFIATLAATNEVPPNNDPTIATGNLSLNGTFLSFTLNVPAVTFISMNAYIQGPALPGANGPIIFDLGGPVFHGGGSMSDPYYAFFSPSTPPFGAGPFDLSIDQINQLMNGLWYVNVTSANFPNGQIRGQIFQVPEPSSYPFIGLGILLLWVARRRIERSSIRHATGRGATAYLD